MEKVNSQKRVKKLSPIVNYNGFEAASDNVPKKAYENIRREIIKRLGISPASYNYKRKGESPLRENEVPVIQEIFSRFSLNAWNGERI